MSSRRYCFTINNPIESDYSNLTLDALNAKFLIYQHETGTNGTPHIQGYVEFGRVVRHSACKHLLPRAHIESAKGDRESNVKYCSKEPRIGETVRLGKDGGQGRRNDIKEYVASVRRGSTDSELLDEHPSAYARYPRLKQQIAIADRRIQPVPLREFREWQRSVLELLKSPPHPRRIHWYWDRTGNTGKTALARHLVSNHNAFYATGGKHADILCAYALEPVIVFDLPRAYKDKVPYCVLENLKNGMIFSSKYESRTLIFDVPHVIVFANFEPDKDQLSEDRWDVHNVVVDVLEYLMQF